MSEGLEYERRVVVVTEWGIWKVKEGVLMLLRVRGWNGAGV